MLFEVENLEYKANGQSIIDGVSLNAQAGDHVLLLGASGCGKTTLMNMMAGLLKLSSGRIVFDGQCYSSLSGRDLDAVRARNFGFVFQKLHLIGHLTVAQNITVPCQTSDPKRVRSLLAELGLAGKEHQKARDLSVGEAQRVAIARAVINNPKVIFADEPTSALDDGNARKVMDLLLDQAQKAGATIIAATHDARIRHYFDTVLEMS